MSITINQTWLRSQSGCRSGRAQFRAHFPRGLVVTERNVARLLVLEPGLVSWGYNRLIEALPPAQRRRLVARLALDVLPHVVHLSDPWRARLTATATAVVRGDAVPREAVTGDSDDAVTMALIAIQHEFMLVTGGAELSWLADTLLFYGLRDPAHHFTADHDGTWLLTAALRRYLEECNGSPD